jgi:hypothetical protein
VSPSPNEESHSKLNTEEWITTHKNNNVKLQKRPIHIRGEMASTGKYVSTENRFSSLCNLERSEFATLKRATKPMKQQTKGKKFQQ